MTGSRDGGYKRASVDTSEASAGKWTCGALGGEFAGGAKIVRGVLGGCAVLS